MLLTEDCQPKIGMELYLADEVCTRDVYRVCVYIRGSAAGHLRTLQLWCKKKDAYTLHYALLYDI